MHREADAANFYSNNGAEVYVEVVAGIGAAPHFNEEGEL